jgi:DNA (cytosine-5)-methyltransferase 1
MPTFGSLFSGVGGFDLGLERAGWECKWQVEIDDWRRAVLESHWPDVQRLADVRDVRGGVWQPLGAEIQHDGPTLAPVDLLCGGFPCQDVSIAGRRAGLAGERSGLFFEFARISQYLRCKRCGDILDPKTIAPGRPQLRKVLRRVGPDDVRGILK